MAKTRSGVGAVLWLGVAGLLVMAVLFAPVMTVGWCADAPVGGTSMCGSVERSIVGIDTSLWLWLGVSVGVAVVVSLVVRRRRSADARN